VLVLLAPGALTLEYIEFMIVRALARLQNGMIRAAGAGPRGRCRHGFRREDAR
jgi:hypothetical protein